MAVRSGGELQIMVSDYQFLGRVISVIGEFHLVNHELLGSLYGRVPDLSDVRIRSMNLSRAGPTLTLRIDLPYFPRSAPRKWIDAGADTVQCQFQFLAVENISLTCWAPPTRGTLVVQPLGRERRMRVSVSGHGIALTFESSEFVQVGHVSAFKVEADGSDGGRHFFVSRVDARKYESLPGTDEKTFYER
ncbi:Imm50 family immunity protein [Streptomyces sp. NPDC096152]|uniref:Imm50 family immunity protein n=1 Tax=Streptomyces sp. NPDC096152 TaxID=3366078 RepID=UPI00381F4DE3